MRLNNGQRQSAAFAHRFNPTPYQCAAHGACAD
jgi:hypothetical protein